MKSRNILTKALKQLVDIRTLLKEAVPRESGISLEPIQIGSKRKKLPFCINNAEKKDLHVGRHGEVAQVLRKVRNVKVHSSKALF